MINRTRTKNNYFLPQAKQSVLANSTAWLSSQLSSLDRDPHPHDLAVTAYALQLADSPAKDAAFQLLSKYRVESDMFMFWGSDNESVRPTRLVKNNPQLLPNPVLCCQSLSVRATSYGLLTYTIRGEYIIEPIVQWINARRHSHNAWAGPVDSAWATEALVMYSLYTTQPQTSMAVQLEFEGNIKKKSMMLTVNQMEIGPHVINLDNFYGHVRVEVMGQGKALIQLHNKYKVLKEKSLSESPVKAYEQDLQVQIMNETKKLMIKTCHR